MVETKVEVDWRAVINRLRYYGYTMEQIGQQVGACRRTIINWREGDCEPSYSRGVRLLSVFQSVVKST